MDDLPLGMNVVPLGWPLMADAFLTCASFNISQRGLVQRFQAETGHQLGQLTARSELEALIDKSTGREKRVLVAWLDWVAINVFGEEQKAERVP